MIISLFTFGSKKYKKGIKLSKVIFLDIDGVLNTSFTRDRQESIDEFRVAYLAEVVHKTNAKIVLTSTWRYNFDRGIFSLKPISKSTKELVKTLKKHKVKISDLLPDTPNDQRAEDILNYIQKNNITQFIILDDELFNYPSLSLDKHLVRTKFDARDEKEAGFTEGMIQRVIELLNK